MKRKRGIQSAYASVKDQLDKFFESLRTEPTFVYATARALRMLNDLLAAGYRDEVVEYLKLCLQISADASHDDPTLPMKSAKRELLESWQHSFRAGSNPVMAWKNEW